VLVFVLAVATALYALNLLLVGELLIGMDEGSSETYTNYAPAPAAIWPLIAALLLVAGMLIHQKLITWIGWIGLTLFSGLFLFSIGGILIPVSAALLPLLVILQAWGGKSVK
jgi:hypothetical protein